MVSFVVSMRDRVNAAKEDAFGSEGNTPAMKLQATIIVSYRADSLSEAGEKLDDLLPRAGERGDVEIESIEVHTPVRAEAVSLPQVGRAAQPRGVVPRATGERDGVSTR
jgi:hypothetical protein